MKLCFWQIGDVSLRQSETYPWTYLTNVSLLRVLLGKLIQTQEFFEIAVEILGPSRLHSFRIM